MMIGATPISRSRAVPARSPDTYQYTVPVRRPKRPAPNRNRNDVLIAGPRPLRPLRGHVAGRLPVPPVERRSLRADRRQPAEVVLRGRRGRDPLERVPAPRVVPGGFAHPERPPQ